MNQILMIILDVAASWILKIFNIPKERDMSNILRNAIVLGFLLFFGAVIYKLWEIGLLGQLMAK